MRPVPKALTLAAALFAHAALCQSLDEISARALAASGGAKALTAVKTVRMTGRISFGTEPASPIVVEMKRPGKIRAELAFAKGPFMQVFDGKTGWVVSPFKEGPQPIEMSPAETRDVAETADFDGVFLEPKRRGISLELLGREMVEGKPAIKLRVTWKNGVERILDIDAASYLKVKWEGALGDPAAKNVQESVFSDYREAGGIRLPFMIRSHAKAGGADQEIVFEKIEVNVPLDDARFTRPPDMIPGKVEK
jgi:outer membrane lipoprotein-sorting protein